MYAYLFGFAGIPKVLELVSVGNLRPVRVQRKLLLEKETSARHERLLLIDGNVDVDGGERVEQRRTVGRAQLLQFVRDPRQLRLLVRGEDDLLLFEFRAERLELRLAHDLRGVAGRLLARRSLRQLVVVQLRRRVLDVELVEHPDELGVVELAQVAQVPFARVYALDQLRLADLVLWGTSQNVITVTVIETSIEVKSPVSRFEFTDESSVYWPIIGLGTRKC